MQFGIEDHGWVTWITILSYFGKKIKIFGDGKQVRDVLFINDLVKLFFRLSKSKKNVIRGLHLQKKLQQDIYIQDCLRQFASGLGLCSPPVWTCHRQ